MEGWSLVVLDCRQGRQATRRGMAHCPQTLRTQPKLNRHPPKPVFAKETTNRQGVMCKVCTISSECKWPSLFLLLFPLTGEATFSSQTQRHSCSSVLISGTRGPH